MSELRVPTVPLTVEILDQEQKALKGRIFLPADAHQHDGPARPHEWINDDAPFFPFSPEDGSSAVLLNKEQIIAVSVPLTAGESAMAADVTHTARVAVECGSSRFVGTLHLDMPDEKRRVLDYANRPERFLTLFDGERCHLIQKAFISRIIEIPEG